MFFSFEGIDGSGKTTQVKLLADKLEHIGKKVHCLREPGNTKLSEAIRELLLDKKYNEMTASAELLLFAASRAQLVHRVIRPALEQGAVVVCDRFTDSTIAYQAFGRSIPSEHVEACNSIATQGVMPDLTFYLNIGLEEATERSTARDGTQGDRIEAAGKEFYQRVLQGYDYIAGQDSQRFIVVDGSLSKESIHDFIWQSVEEKLGL